MASSFKVSFGNGDGARDKRKYHATAKYDRAAVQKRLELEEWIDTELRKLFDCEDDEDPDVEIDLDEIIPLDEQQQKTEIKNLLSDCKKTEEIQKFTDDLLIKMKKL